MNIHVMKHLSGAAFHGAIQLGKKKELYFGFPHEKPKYTQNH